ncbi:hypothetical protein LEP3755_66360 (plasmid) [Leptolyngbya sp. NIES-3755]|nr:hypothetical protein LEP3755_66360 [Leptolyngbya sp. NIES-3755]
MLQRFTIGLLTFSLAQSVSVPTIAQTRPTPACKNSIAVSQSASLIYPTGSVRGISLQQAEQRAAIAIEFLRANRPDRANQVNEALRSRLELSASEMAVLRTIQYLEAGKNQAAIALFPELKRPEAYRRSISLQLERIPLQAKAAWILQAVDYFPEPDEDEINYQQQWNLPTLKAEWMLLLAESYRTQGKATEAVKILDQARMLLNWNNNAEALQFVEAYRKAEQPEKARTILTPIAAQLLRGIEAQPGETVRPKAIQNLIKAGHELALLEQSSEALPLLNQAEALIKSVDRSNVKPLQQLLVLAYAAAGQTTQALQIVQTLDSPDARENYVALAKQSAELGDSRSAQQFLQSIRDQWTASRASFDVVKLLTDAELFPAAYDIATSIADSQMRLEAMATIVKRADQAKQSALSTQIIAEMQRVKSGEFSGFQRLDTIRALVQVGERTRVRSLLAELVQQPDLAWLNLQIAEQYAAIGEFDQATRLIDQQRTNRVQSKISVLPVPVVAPPLDLPIDQLSTPLGVFFSNVLFDVNLPQRAPDTRPVQRRISPIPSILSKQSKKPRAIQPPPKLPPILRLTPEENRALDEARYIRAYAQARNFTKAANLLAQIPDHLCLFKAELFDHIAIAALEAGQLETALNGFQQAKRLSQRASRVSSERIDRFIAIAKLYSERNRTTEAIRLLETTLALLSNR